MKISNLKFLLEQISDIQGNSAELNLLISYSIKIASAHLHTKYLNNISKLSFSEQNDLAMDSIVPLFIRKKSGKLAIIEAANNWNLGLENHSDVDYFIHRLVWKSVNQTVFNVFKEKDPIFDKINKTISTCIINNNYAKVKILGTVYIVKDENKKLYNKLITEKEFSLIPSKYFISKQDKLLKGLWKYIYEDLEFSPAIPLNLLVKRIKQLSENLIGSYSENQNVDINYAIDINEFAKRSYSNIKKQIKKTYLNKNKISDKEAVYLKNAFKNIIFDMKFGGLSSSLYEYLNSEMKILTKDEFYSKYHNIMNYLLKEIKSDIKKMLI